MIHLRGREIVAKGPRLARGGQAMGLAEEPGGGNTFSPNPAL